MEKRIAELSSDPYTVSLTDRKCSLFIDPNSGAIFVDEGDGDDRMNGAVFSAMNSPSFSVQSSTGPDHHLLLDYRGTQYDFGVSADGDRLKSWAAGANLLLIANGNSQLTVPERNGLAHKALNVNTKSEAMS